MGKKMMKFTELNSIKFKGKIIFYQLSFRDILALPTFSTKAIEIGTPSVFLQKKPKHGLYFQTKTI